MKRFFHAFFMCQSMFCAIPCPCRVWDEEARPLMLPMLPLVGLEIGALWAFFGWLTAVFGLPVLIRALVLALWPYLATGYLHLDGFMDVTDAVKSCRDLNRRREILKDSHVGSFAVIGLCMLLLTQFAVFASISADKSCLILLFLPAVSRCGSALAVTALPSMSTSQYAAQKKPTAHLVVITAMLCLFVVLGFVLCGRMGFALVGCVAGYTLALRRGYRSLQGMNGDIAGYALTIGELCGAAVFALL
ncbi:MAG: adenosylcobinamide-GDP ribazoletransferase [Eubacteriales bacterium]|nr:adenosylcobinamide-GDP ribazoletransferase [Eubacteriales bacterium]